MKSERDKVLSLIRRANGSTPEWEAKAIARAEALMEHGSPASLLHTMTVLIPPAKLHGLHTTYEIEVALDFEEEHLKHLSREY